MLLGVLRLSQHVRGFHVVLPRRFGFAKECRICNLTQEVQEQKHHLPGSPNYISTTFPVLEVPKSG